MLINKTNRKHHNEYGELSKQVTDDEINKFLIANNLNVKILKAKYRRDPFLFNLDDSIFDNNIHPVAKKYDDFDTLINVCLWKHILIYRVLGAKPLFVGKLHELMND